MSNTVVQPVAPVMPHQPAGKDAHKAAMRVTKAFPLTAPIYLKSPLNPWRGRGQHFWTEVLQPNPGITVGEAIDKAVAMGIDKGLAMDHLRWLYTWPAQAGRPVYVEIGGAVWPEVVPSA